MTKGKSELLELLNARKAWELPPYRRPIVNLDRVYDAAKAYARAEDSDPFAYARMLHSLFMGFELASDIYKDSVARIGRRAGQTLSIEGLAPLKRQIDQDRAWNQHNSAMFREEH